MVLLTKPVFEKLIEHLLYIEESADKQADFYFPDSPEDQKELKDFFKYYIKKIEKVMEHISVVNSFANKEYLNTLNTFPFAIIDSEVELQDSSGKATYTYRIIHPDSQCKAKNGITYLSPLGKSLLLKETGSEVEIDIYGEAFQIVKIKSVRLPA